MDHCKLQGLPLPCFRTGCVLIPLGLFELGCQFAVCKVDVSSASIGRLQSHRFSSTNEQTIQADWCCAGAPGCPIGSTTGAPETHCSAMWFMTLAGYPPPLSDRQDDPVKSPDKGQTRQTNSGTNHPRRRAKLNTRDKIGPSGTPKDSSP